MAKIPNRPSTEKAEMAITKFRIGPPKESLTKRAEQTHGKSGMGPCLSFYILIYFGLNGWSMTFLTVWERCHLCVLDHLEETWR